MDTITWVSDETWHHRDVGGTVKRCPHCEAFARRHHLWHVLMHGGYHPTTCRRVRGYKLYCELLDTYGSIEGWRDEWRSQGKREHAARKAHREWTERNFIPLDNVSKDRYGIPNMRDGRALRKDTDHYFKRQRANERAERRRQREREIHERRRRHMERLKARARRRLAARRPPFLIAAENIINVLPVLTGEASNDSQEN